MPTCALCQASIGDRDRLALLHHLAVSPDCKEHYTLKNPATMPA